MNGVNEMQVVVAKLTQAVESGFAAMDRRMVEFSARLSEMERLQRVANGGLNRHEVNIETMEVEIERQRKTAHDMQNQLHGLMPLSDLVRDVSRRMNDHPLAGYPQQDPQDDNRRITQRDVMMLLAGGGGLIGCWKFVEWAVHVLKSTP